MSCINFNYFENERDMSFATLNGQLSCLFISGLLSSRESDIDPRAKALWSISLSRDDNSTDMENGMH
jgi:hypothetical protein